MAVAEQGQSEAQFAPDQPAELGPPQLGGLIGPDTTECG